MARNPSTAVRWVACAARRTIARLRRARSRTAPTVPALLAAAMLAATAGCATPPPPAAPRTTVVLLPDDDGAVGAVTITNAAGTSRLDRAYTAATIDAAAAPSPAHELGRDQVDSDFGALLKSQPPAPVTFTLHFVLDRTELTEASKSQLPALLAAVRERAPTEITIYGHADSSGSDKRNLELSAARAKVVADWLRGHDPRLDRVELQWFGDKVPLVPSAPGATEPRNRRAEVTVL